MIGNGVIDGDSVDAVERVVQRRGVDRFFQRTATRAADFVGQCRNVDDVGCTSLRESQHEEKTYG